MAVSERKPGAKRKLDLFGTCIAALSAIDRFYAGDGVKLNIIMAETTTNTGNILRSLDALVDAGLTDKIHADGARALMAYTLKERGRDIAKSVGPDNLLHNIWTLDDGLLETMMGVYKRVGRSKRRSRLDIYLDVIDGVDSAKQAMEFIREDIGEEETLELARPTTVAKIIGLAYSTLVDTLDIMVENGHAESIDFYTNSRSSRTLKGYRLTERGIRIADIYRQSPPIGASSATTEADRTAGSAHVKPSMQRSELEMTLDTMSAIGLAYGEDVTSLTRLSFRANVNYGTLTQIMEILLKENLVEEDGLYAGTKIYRLTDVGQGLLDIYDRDRVLWGFEHDNRALDTMIRMGRATPNKTRGPFEIYLDIMCAAKAQVRKYKVRLREDSCVETIRGVSPSTLRRAANINNTKQWMVDRTIDEGYLAETRVFKNYMHRRVTALYSLTAKGSSVVEYIERVRRNAKG